MSLSDALFALTSSHSEGRIFTLLILSFVVQKVLNLICEKAGIRMIGQADLSEI